MVARAVPSEAEGVRRAALLITILGALLLPGQALAGGGNYVFDGGTAAQQAQVRAALEASAFDWGVVPARITIHLRRGGPTMSVRGHIWIDSDVLSAGRFAWAVVQDEYAHQVDYYRFDDATRAMLNAQLGGRDWCYSVPGLAHHEYGCERFASTLVWSYWPSRDNAYRPTSKSDESAAMEPARFRALVSGLIGMRDPFAVRALKVRR
jgi:hypothetical protein